MTLRFGTDGIRGAVDRDLTPELVTALGRAAARVLGTDRPFFVGRDTRRSGPLLEAALVAGLCSEGAGVERVGVLPTPAVAYLAQLFDGHGAMISASHNPYPDNGVKLFARGGRKIADEPEQRIEAELRRLVDAGTLTEAEVGPERREVGVARDRLGAAADYIAHLAAAPGRRLDGQSVVVDCGNGAAYEVAPWALRVCGASVRVLHNQPDGTNINAGCGSTDPSELRQAVLAAEANAGLAFDGDADRVIAVDERGNLVDGDQMLAIIALDLHERGELRGDAVVATVMSNLGLRRALGEHGIELVETPVGDRNVLAALEERGLSLGGEQSGHVILADLATTGDGTLTGLTLLDVMARSGRPLSELAAVVEPLPQVLRSVKVGDRAGLEQDGAFRAELAAVEQQLGADGRVVVRPSGTEPVVRVMVEAPTSNAAETAATRLAAAVERACGTPN
ncbi:MAG TPA: phosphoglucosamine mutase [Acidimicrobiia bacterium]|nr:phosphoglucosamine mutase [Acidimicrobiia bacterium]